MTSQDERFLRCVTVAELEQMKALGQLAKKRFVLETADGRIANDQRRFFDAVSRSLPLDPHYDYPPGIRSNWDSLDDSVFGGLLGLGVAAADIIWPFANDVAIAFLVKGVKFLARVAGNVRDRDYGPLEDNSVFVRLFLVCSNETSKQRLEAEFWFLK
ncbi:MAG TPA: hypothetical protein VGE07_13710 [Herpetosiphonaceae bacterium]